MVRTVLILIFVALISTSIAWVADAPGKVVVYWANYRIDASLFFALAAIAAFSLLCVVSYALLYMLVRTPRHFKRSYKAKRQTLGLEALTQTFAAIATQDYVAARKQLKAAQTYLPRQPITLMLSAQLARLEGNETQAHLYIEQMLGDETTKFLALKNLIESARKSNDLQLALKHSQEALLVKPQDNWLIATVAELYAKTGHIQDAARLLDFSLKKCYISKQFYRREIAYMYYENAKSLGQNGQVRHAISALEESIKKLPDFAPASALIAEMHLLEDNAKESIKAISKAWKIAPHKDLREVLKKILQKHANDKKLHASVKKITTLNPEHEESLLLVKEMNAHE